MSFFPPSVLPALIYTDGLAGNQQQGICEVPFFLPKSYAFVNI